MSRDLAAEIVAHLIQVREDTAMGAARAVKARTADVLQLVRTDSRFSGPHRGGDGRLYYRLASDAPIVSAGRGTRSRRRSQLDRVLEILADGKWHTTAEILRLVPCVLHSRIAEARARGLNVECDHTAGVGAESYRYRLVAGPLTGEGVANSGSIPSGGAAMPAVSSPSGSAANIEPFQLTIGQAA